MLVLNFSHPLLPEHIEQLESITKTAVQKVLDIETMVDTEKPLAPQITTLANQAQLSGTEWETLPILINPPSLNHAAIVLLAELHGRMGYFPAHLRLKPFQENSLTRYRVAEVINLQSIRAAARGSRK